MAEYPFVFLYLLYITSYKKRAKVVEMRFFFVLLTKKSWGGSLWGSDTVAACRTRSCVCRKYAGALCRSFVTIF